MTDNVAVGSLTPTSIVPADGLALNKVPTLEQALPAAAPSVVEEKISIEDFAKVQLRVALIESVERLPKSKKLLKLQLSLGPTLGKRQILAGVAQFYEPEQLVGKKIVVVANLQPAKLMGEESQGMLLAASNEDTTKLIILDPGQDMPEGSVVR